MLKGTAKSPLAPSTQVLVSRGPSNSPQHMGNTAGSHQPQSLNPPPQPQGPKVERPTLPSSKAKEWGAFAPQICLTVLHSSLPYITHWIGSPKIVISLQLPSQKSLSSHTAEEGGHCPSASCMAIAPYPTHRGLPVTNPQPPPLYQGHRLPVSMWLPQQSTPPPNPLQKDGPNSH